MSRSGMHSTSFIATLSIMMVMKQSQFAELEVSASYSSDTYIRTELDMIQCIIIYTTGSLDHAVYRTTNVSIVFQDQHSGNSSSTLSYGT